MLAHSPTRSLATCPNPLGSGLRLRGSQARKNGIEYDVIIDEGSLGLEVVNLMVTGIMPGGQAEAKGVLAGSKILGINGRRCKDDVGFAGLLAMVPRPFKLLLGKVRTPRALAGDVFVLEGTLAKGKRWRARRAEVDGTTNTLSFSADGSSKKEKKEKKKWLKEPLLLADWDVESPGEELLERHAAFEQREYVGPRIPSAGALALTRLTNCCFPCLASCVAGLCGCYDPRRQHPRAHCRWQWQRKARWTLIAGSRCSK